MPIVRKDELRLKSNTDLHKLWYILLKERNMLLTMQEAYKDEFIAMPNPERVDKVEMSMENLEEVVRERNKAFYQLEVGVSGERERVHRQDCFGRVVPYKKREHVMPYHMNTSYRQKLRFRFLNTGRADVLDFQARLREKMYASERGIENTQMRMVRYYSQVL
jgi:large subunit ribosomal protein L47